MPLTGELPGLLQANPPKHAYSAAVLLFAGAARQYFELEIADLYFPWLVAFCRSPIGTNSNDSDNIVQRIKRGSPLADRYRAREAG
jgi:hypothetical protein